MSLSSDLQELNVRTAGAVHQWMTTLEQHTSNLVKRAEQLEGGVMSSPLGPIAEALGKFALEQPDIALVVSLIGRIGKPIVAAVEAAAAEAAPAGETPAGPAPAGPDPAGPIEAQARAAVTS